MKEQLTLERVAIYLPYGLECIYGGHGHDKKVKIIGLHTNEDEETYDYTFIDKMGDVDSDVFGWIKLILRPLSDLTKEIEVNGEKFVPIDVIKDEFLECDILIYGDAGYGWIGLYNDNTLIPFYMECDMEIMPEIHYRIVTFLAKWHFDIHGLISKGLAIDINTL